MTFLQRWRAAGLILPTILTLLVLPALIGLGTWQWHRKEWKEDLIARLEARRAAEPSTYADVMSKYVQTGDVEYMRVRLTGTFDHAAERHVYAPTSAAQGWHIYTPLKPDTGMPSVYINRGWVPDNLKNADQRTAGQVTGPVTVTGLVRLSHPNGWFTPDPDYTGNRYYSRDLDAMRWGSSGPPSQLEFSARRLEAYAPFSIDAEAAPANPGGYPKGGTTEFNIPNSHLQYVVTWYGIALTLIGVFAAFAHQRLQSLKDERKDA